MINKSTMIHQSYNEVDVSNYKQPHGLQQWEKPIP